MDLYRDQKEINKQVLIERLKRIHPFEYKNLLKPSKLPATIHQVSRKVPSWYLSTIWKRRNKLGPFRYLRNASAILPLENNFDLFVTFSDSSTQNIPKPSHLEESFDLLIPQQRQEDDYKKEELNVQTTIKKEEPTSETLLESQVTKSLSKPSKKKKSSIHTQESFIISKPSDGKDSAFTQLDLQKEDDNLKKTSVVEESTEAILKLSSSSNQMLEYSQLTTSQEDNRQVLEKEEEEEEEEEEEKEREFRTVLKSYKSKDSSVEGSFTLNTESDKKEEYMEVGESFTFSKLFEKKNKSKIIEETSELIRLANKNEQEYEINKEMDEVTIKILPAVEDKEQAFILENDLIVQQNQLDKKIQSLNVFEGKFKLFIFFGVAMFVCSNKDYSMLYNQSYFCFFY